MVILKLNNIHDVLANVFMYATNQFPESHIQFKKREFEAERWHKHLDFVVLWALREFKIGILNPFPLSDCFWITS